MPREWYATCKDCGKEYGYSDDSYQTSVRKGMSRPERCPECRKLHSREITTLGLSHFELTPISPIPSSGLQSGRLGGLVRPPRVHEARNLKPSFDLNKFGIKDAHIQEYFDLMKNKQVTVVVAPTGAGKSTFLPYRLMVPPEPFPKDMFTQNGQIVITQPRIQATRNIPLFVARDLHGSNLGAGFDVGFRHSGSPSTDWRNKMVYMTDGTLINMIVRNELGRVGVIMIDEAHERSLNIDLILGLLRTQLSRYPKLKLIIASATINAGMFLEYYGGEKGFDPDKFASDTGEGFLAYDNQQIANALNGTPVGFYGFPGKRQHPVETRFREEDPIPEGQWSGRMPEEMAKKILQILRDIQSEKEPARGDILGFLHGKVPIENAVKLVCEGVEDDPMLAGKVDVLPLYTDLSQKQQDAALLPKKKKDRLRVVISTNVAETSLTVDGIVHVVESGLINESQWDSKTQTSFVVPKIHSQSGCKQRWGRGGRIQPGVAHCLYTAEQFDKFPKHTDPEIMRAPLDQIVLTAKAAGIDDVRTFEWIQRPSQDELDRAPRFLQQIGAIDEQGDLTEHGLELRSFGEEVDIANLMILADRFGCAVEMATILPMRNLGGYTKLLLWDKGWDAHTKRAVHKIHQGLLGTCMDDVEFSLKMWQAWEGTSFGRNAKADREKWSGQYFVNHRVFRDQISSERESLLAALSAHKKEQVYRPINFDLLTRLRILMTHGLPSQIYLLDETQKTELELKQMPVYKPYIPNSSNSPELELLHSDAVVEISPESICSNRAMQAFVCGKRQRIRRRMSPLSEPLTIITASFLTLIKPEWLQYINQPLMNLARLIAAETRNLNGELITTITQARLFVDQTYSIGATFHCQGGEKDDGIKLGKLVSAAPQIQPSRSNEDIDGPVDIEYLEPEKAVQATGVTDEDQKYIIDIQENTEDVSQWMNALEKVVDGSNPVQETAIPQEKSQTQNIFEGRVIHRPQGQLVESEFNAFVTGYDFSEPNRPIVLLEIPDNPTPFNKFCSAYKTGDTISVKVSSIEQYVNDRLIYLAVREEKSGLEMILDPYDASLSGRNVAVEILQPNDKLDATIEDIDAKAKRVRITRLKQAEEEFLQFMGRGEEKMLDAVICEVRDNGLYVWVNQASSTKNIPIVAFVYIDRLPQRPEEMWLGRTCKVKVRPQSFKRDLRRGFGVLPDNDYQKFKKFSWDGKLRFDEETNRIVANRRITHDQRVRLLGLSSQNEFQKAINILYRRSNEVEARVLDMTGIENLAQYQGQRTAEKWKVTKVLDDSIFVSSPDGFETVVPKREVVYDLNTNLREALTEGTPVTVTVKQVDVEDGKVNLSLLSPEDDPLRKFSVNQVVQGKVVGFTKDGSVAFVEIEPGAEGFVYKDEIKFASVQDAREVLNEGQIVHVRIINLDMDNRKMRLTIRGLYEAVIQSPLSHIRLIKGPRGSTITQITNETETKIDIEDDGLCIIQGLTSQNVEFARQRIQKILETRIVTFRIQDLQARKLVGKGGETIKGIQNDTGAQIQVDSNTNQVTVTAENDRVLHVCLEHIKDAITYYQATIRVPLSMLGRVIGPKGSNIQSIAQNGVRVNVSKDQSGIITVDGKSKSLVEQSVQRIQYHAGSVEYISVNEGNLPAFQDVQQNTASPRRASQQTQESASVPSRLPPAPPISKLKPVAPQPAPPSSPTQPRYFQSQLRIRLKALPILLRKEGGFLVTLFGGGKSVLEKIMEGTQTQIKVNSTTGVITIIGRTQDSVNRAVQMVQSSAHLS